MNDTVEEAKVTDQEYEAIYKAAETKLVLKYDQLITAHEKKQLFQKVTRLFVKGGSTIALLAILVGLED